MRARSHVGLVFLYVCVCVWGFVRVALVCMRLHACMLAWGREMHIICVVGVFCGCVVV